MQDPRTSSLLSALALLPLALLLTACVERREFLPPDEEPPPPPPPTPTAPVLRLPANNSYQGSVHHGSLRPSFQWEASQWSGTEIVRYTIQLSTEATFTSGLAATEETTSTSFQMSRDLTVSREAPVGARYFWRVKACAGDACSGFSPVWYVNVGRVRRDLNGDGYADVALTARGQATVSSTAGRLYVYLGGSGAFNTQADTIFNGSGTTWFRNVADIGDLNGDGFADLAALVTQTNGQMPRVLIYLGGKGTVLDSTPAHTLAVNGCAALGDWNNDGFDDLLLAPSGETTGILLGSKAALAPAAPFAVSADARGAGDVNGDGFADLLSRGLDNDVLLYFGSAAPPYDHESHGRLTGVPSAQFGSSLAAAGDVNGDGFADVLVGAPADSTKASRGGRAFAYLGGRGAAFDVMPDAIFEGAADEQLGYAVAGVGDLNGDGYDDLGIRTFIDLQGRMYVYYGKQGSTLDTSLRTKLEGEPGKTSLFGASALGGDVNGDGFDDLWVGAPMYSTQATFNVGRAYVFLGAAGATIEQLPDATLDQGEGDNASFGHLSLRATDLSL